MQLWGELRLNPACRATIAAILLSVASGTTAEENSGSQQPIQVHIDDAKSEEEQDGSGEPVVEFRSASLIQPQPGPILPRTEAAPPVGSSMTTGSASLFGDLSRSTLTEQRRARANTPGSNVIFGTDARIRVSTDAGSVLGKTPSVLGVGVQRRTPIVTDPRVRGDRIGRLAAKNSYWVPARMDLDTMLSKIDSRAIEDMIVIKGPYSAVYGPGFDFADVKLTPSPRFQDGYESFGSSSLDYKTNGENLFGRQSIWGGAEDYGFQVNYGHWIGNDYESGNDTDIPSSFNSRDWNGTIGYDLPEGQHLEFRYLRLDQTNVEFPGQAFDIDFLVTDGFDVEYAVDDLSWCDRVELDSWYNRTRFEGSAQRLGKRQIFPYYDFINFVGFTDVDSMSTGFRAMAFWGDVECCQTTLGADLRYLKQELNEFTSGRIGPAIWNNANSPIPDSYSANPGLFIEQLSHVSDRFSMRLGGRLDSATTNVTASPAAIAALGLEIPQSSLADIVGSDDFDQSFSLFSAYVTGDYALTDYWSSEGGVGYAERPPNMTELYAAQPFMFLLQNGLNTVTGDPELAPERKIQLDLGLRYNDGGLRGGVHGFYAWMHDYITFENLRVVTGPPSGQIVQTSLKFVNTDLATLVGGEMFGECDISCGLTAFVTLNTVQGRDRTRNGSFATQRATPGNPSTQFFGLPRGFFSGIAGSMSEPLPSISPPESRVGLRFHSLMGSRPWFVELSARMVDKQDRVAASLLESTTPGFTIWDLRAYCRTTDAITLVGGVENFGDRNYREHLDFRALDGVQMFQPGVSFYGGAEFIY